MNSQDADFDVMLETIFYDKDIIVMRWICVGSDDVIMTMKENGCPEGGEQNATWMSMHH